MIKAVFFDLYHTLVRYDPPREELEAEAIYVGDQYEIDIIGDSRAGMNGVLLDRGGYSDKAADCPRIRTLAELAPCPEL